MRPLKEDTPHELYLRTTSATKQSAPLKHYANVTGKFTVERQLDQRMKDKLREKTSDAAKQKEDRKTIFIDNPPTLPSTNSKKRKKEPTAMFRNAVRQSDQAKLSAPARAPSPAPSKKKSTDTSTSVPLRKRLVHCMAINERSQDTVIRMVAGSDCDSSARQEVLELLGEVCLPCLHSIHPCSWRF